MRDKNGAIYHHTAAGLGILCVLLAFSFLNISELVQEFDQTLNLATTRPITREIRQFFEFEFYREAKSRLPIITQN